MSFFFGGGELRFLFFFLAARPRFAAGGLLFPPPLFKDSSFSLRFFPPPSCFFPWGKSGSASTSAKRHGFFSYGARPSVFLLWPFARMRWQAKMIGV